MAEEENKTPETVARDPERVKVEAELYHETGVASHHEVSNNGSADGDKLHNADGTVYNEKGAASGAPMRNEIQRYISFLKEGIINPRLAVRQDLAIVVAENGNVAMTHLPEVGGADSKGLFLRPDPGKDAKAGADVDLSPGVSSRLNGHFEGGRFVLGAVDNVRIKGIYPIASGASYRTDIPPEEKEKLLQRLYALEQQVKDNGGIFPINRDYDPANRQLIRRADGSVHSPTLAEHNKFWGELAAIRAEVRTEPSNAQSQNLSKLAADFNAGKVTLAQVKEQVGTVFNSELLEQNQNIASLKLPEAMTKGVTPDPTPFSQGAAYAKYDPSRPRTREDVERRLTSGMEGQQPSETEEEFKIRRRNHMNGMLAEMPSLEQAIFMFICALCGIDIGNLDSRFASLSNDESLPEPHRRAARSMSTAGGRAAGVDLSGLDLNVDPASVQPVEGLNIVAGSGDVTEAYMKARLVKEMDPYIYHGRLEDIPKDAVVVVTDGGHLAQPDGSGATIPIVGPKGSRGEVLEKSVNITANVAAAKFLHEHGVYVIPTYLSEHFRDNTLTPGARREFMDKWIGGRGENGLAMVWHTNSSTGKAEGIQTYISGDGPTRATLMFASAGVQSAKQNGLFEIAGNGAYGPGVFSEYQSQHSTGLSVMSRNFNTVLYEGGFLETEYKKLSNEQFMAKYGTAMAQSVVAVFEKLGKLKPLEIKQPEAVLAADDQEKDKDGSKTTAPEIAIIKEDPKPMGPDKVEENILAVPEDTKTENVITSLTPEMIAQIADARAGKKGDHVAHVASASAEITATVPFKLSGKDKELYKDAPENWGQLTEDMKVALAKVPKGTVVTQMVSADSIGGVWRVYGTMARIQEDGSVIAVPILNGGANRGATDESVNGGRNKIKDETDKHVTDWGCRFYNWEREESTDDDGKQRTDLGLHTVARVDGTSSGCTVTIKSTQKQFETMMSAAAAQQSDYLTIRSPLRGGLAAQLQKDPSFLGTNDNAQLAQVAAPAKKEPEFNEPDLGVKDVVKGVFAEGDFSGLTNTRLAYLQYKFKNLSPENQHKIAVAFADVALYLKEDHSKDPYIDAHDYGEMGKIKAAFQSSGIYNPERDDTLSIAYNSIADLEIDAKLARERKKGDAFIDKVMYAIVPQQQVLAAIEEKKDEKLAEKKDKDKDKDSEKAAKTDEKPPSTDAPPNRVSQISPTELNKVPDSKRQQASAAAIA